MSNVFGRKSRQVMPVAVAGDGIYVIDNTGKRYLDACGGAAVSSLGHSNSVITDAVTQQLAQLAWAHTGFFTTEPAEQLAQWLAERSPADLNHVYLVSGGSEAVEAALKLTRQYWIERDQPQRTEIVSRRQSYHGNTLGALSAGGNQWRRQPFEPMLTNNVHLIDPCYFYRGANPGEGEFEFGQRIANQLEHKISELGNDRVAAFIAEPVVGATLGAVTAVAGYFTRIREICDRYGVLLIFDEVMCGMGRTGSLFACEQEQVTPDIICIAKALGAGFQPIGAMLCRSAIFDAIADGSGFFQHGHTYLAHPTACAAALAVQKEVESRDLLANVREQGSALLAQLNSALAYHPNVGDVRGRGLFIGVELVENKISRSPLDPALKTHAMIKSTAMDNGLMVYPMGGTLDGRSGDHILLAPPYIVNAVQVREIVDRLVRTIETVLPFKTIDAASSATKAGVA
ncbi:MAG: aspartate aminotransferase family protein [Burkholderiaceae bacterium]